MPDGICVFRSSITVKIAYDDYYTEACGIDICHADCKPGEKNSPPPFQLVAGHPVLDFVNTLDWRFRSTGPEELISGYDVKLRQQCVTSGPSSRHSDRDSLGRDRSA
jgi:hypothetical protein